MTQLNKVKNLFSFSPTTNDPFEPGLLPAFRLFVAIQIVGVLVAATLDHYIDSPFYIGIPGRLLVAILILHFIYLSWPKLCQWLGKFYLPLALLVAVATPLLERVATVFILDSDLKSVSSLYFMMDGGWRTIVVLTMPAIFVAWQYRFRVVLLFSMTILILNNVLLGFAMRIDPGYWLYLVDYGVIGAGVFVLIGVIVTKLITGQREKQRRLVEANRQLVEYARTVEQLAISHERNRMARDLHDTVLHTLSAVSMQLEASDAVWEQSPARAHKLVRSSLDSTRSGLAETRRALRSLRASPLEDLGFRLALYSFAESTTSRNGIRLVTNMPETLHLSDEVEEGVYRIGQEALRNAVKHSDASTIWLNIEESEEMYTMEIKDDGIGMDDQSVGVDGHYGLLGMRERAESIGVTYSMQSKPGRGTTVRLGIPKLEVQT